MLRHQERYDAQLYLFCSMTGTFLSFPKRYSFITRSLRELLHKSTRFAFLGKFILVFYNLRSVAPYKYI